MTGQDSTTTVHQQFQKECAQAAVKADDRQTQDEGVIVLATATDLSVIQPLLQAADLPIAGLANHLKHLYVLKIDDRILGAVGFEAYSPYALIRSLVVAPEIRGQGLGRRLLKFILETLQLQGFQEVYALTLTIADWLKRSGFEEIPRQDIPSVLTASLLFNACCCSSAQVYRLQL